MVFQNCSRPVGITKPNFVKISQMAAEVLGFNGVQNGGRLGF